MSIGALSFVMFRCRGMSITSVRRSIRLPECMMGMRATGPGPLIPWKTPHLNRAIRS